MSHLEERKRDLQLKKAPKKRTSKTITLIDYVEDPKREDSLIGLQYVVEIKMLDTDKSIVKCNLCCVKGKMATMKEHLVGVNHIKVYMEKHYSSVIQSLKKSSHQKSHFAKLLKNYAKEIERAEGTQSIKIEYVSAADMNKEQENWMAEHEERSEFHTEQKKFQVLDRRQLALNYSETFKISSREEATIVLNLTQQLSDQLEQYFLKFRGLDILESTMPGSISTNSSVTPTNLSSNVHNHLHPANQGFKSIAKEMQWHTEDPSSSSVCPPASDNSFDSMPLKLKDTQELKHKSKEDTWAQKRKPKEDSLVQKRKPEEDSRGQKSKTKLDIWGHERKSKGDIRGLKRKPELSEDDSKEFDKFPRSKDAPETSAETSNLGAENITIHPEPSTSSSSYSYNPSSERPSSSHTQGKTSKSLSPEILQLLKGKDANTVTNILRTLSPFYPALQEVNLEMLAQVLVNTGVLD